VWFVSSRSEEVTSASVSMDSAIRDPWMEQSVEVISLHLLTTLLFIPCPQKKCKFQLLKMLTSSTDLHV